MQKLTRVCFQCKQSFLKDEMHEYASARAKQLHWYCEKCYQEKIARENFSDVVCKIFGIKMPGPRIWTERKRLIDTYGYTDQTIIDCLNYLYNIKHTKKLAESLYLVNPTNVEEMLSYKRAKSFEAAILAKAMQTETKEYIVPTQKKKNDNKNIIEYDLDEWLDD